MKAERARKVLVHRTHVCAVGWNFCLCVVCHAAPLKDNQHVFSNQGLTRSSLSSEIPRYSSHTEFWHLCVGKMKSDLKTKVL